jgi:WD40 repeat protein
MSRVDFLFGGQRILTYSTNGLLRLWDTASFELLNTLDVENANYAVAMDGKRLIFNKTDGTVHIWRMPENTQELVNLACEHFPGPLTVLDRQEFALDPSPEHYPCNLKP